ncbi:insulinase family protein [Alcanivorax profundi]|uniref:Insulinase family protein n=1 Tax=Alcanivorax profundi TaxID=2338368 RepID=A0A418XZ53_9GAMM|nr:pitrilysin family protein [Alcanivorax profundi]RJG18291.1 insulinase family protein [Alcanivorax profundi]
MKRLIKGALLPVLAVLLSACQSMGAFPTTEAQVAASEPQAPALDIQSWQTAEGARVLFVASDALPMLDVRLVMAAGSSRDNGVAGLSSLTSALLGEGAAGLNVDDISRGFEDHGAQFDVGSYRDMGVVELRTLSDPEFRDPVLTLFNQVIATPSFPQDALDRIRTQMMQGLRMEQQVPGPQVKKAYMATVFAGHPYGEPSDGTLATLPAITREQLVEFYNTYYAAGNTVIAMVGDVSREQAEQIAGQISQSLPEGGAAPPQSRAQALTERKHEHINFPSAQTHILLGNQATWRGNPDHVALYVGNMVLGGGGFASILTDEVRQKRGYVYGIGSGFSAMASGGPFQVSFKTANENADDALSLTLKLIDDFVESGPTETQLEEARTSILGSFALGTADNSDIIGQLGAIGFYDLPLDYLQWFNQQVQNVTTNDIREAFQRHLVPANLAIISIGPQAPEVKAVGDDLQAGEQGGVVDGEK